MLHIVIWFIVMGLAAYIIVTHYLMRQQQNANAETVKRVLHDALQDSRSGAAYNDRFLGMSIERIASGTGRIRTLLDLLSESRVNQVTKEDVSHILLQMEQQKEKVMEHMHEKYPEIMPANRDVHVTFPQDFSHAGHKDAKAAQRADKEEEYKPQFIKQLAQSSPPSPRSHTSRKSGKSRVPPIQEGDDEDEDEEDVEDHEDSDGSQEQGISPEMW